MILISVTLAGFACGASSSWTSPALPMLQSANSTIQVTNDEGSWIGSFMPIGGIIGAIPTGYTADLLGRKITITLIAIPFVVGWIVITFAESVLILCCGRVVIGLGCAAISVMAPMYITEIAEVNVRGILSSFFILLVNAGILFSYIIGSIVSYTWLNIICTTIPIVFFITFIWMPETPIYLVSKSRKEEAERSLKFFRGQNFPIAKELGEIEKIVRETEEDKGSLKDIFVSPVTRKAFIICIGLMMCQQFSGVVAIVFFTVQIFNDAGSSLSPNLSTIMVGAVQLAVTYLSSLLVDRAGRKILMIISEAVMCICMGIMGLYYYFKASYDVESYGWVPLVSVNMFIASFGIGAAPIPWIILGEILPNSVKSSASAIVVTFLWFLVFCVSKFFQNFLDIFGSAVTFWIFGSCCALGVIFVIKFVPETKGKTYLEIQKELGNDSCDV